MTEREVRIKDIRFAQKITAAKIGRMCSASVVTAADGCRVEPDGVCEHGHQSPLLVLGYI
jgi:hypothetical protein